MSVNALAWALRVQSLRSSTKFVLVALCNYANEFGECYPSAKQLAQDTCQDIKTIESNLRILREMGLIVDTGHRRGATKQVIVYRIVPSATELSTTDETPPKQVVLNTPVFPVNTPVFPEKHPQISGETPPKTGDGTIKEPSRNHQGINTKSKTAVAACPDDVDPGVWGDFAALRKQHNATLTETALKGLRREGQKAGMDLQEVLEFCCQQGYRGFKAAWVQDRPRYGAQPANTHKHAAAAATIYEGVWDA